MEILASSIVTEILLIIALIILIICAVTGNWKGAIIGGIVLIMLTIIEIPIISDIQNDKTESTAIESKITNTQPEPSALDVYRGLTELEITSVNGVPKDSVVVLKKK